MQGRKEGLLLPAEDRGGGRPGHVLQTQVIILYPVTMIILYPVTMIMLYPVISPCILATIFQLDDKVDESLKVSPSQVAHARCAFILPG